jgi:hypothetical protein
MGRPHLRRFDVSKVGLGVLAEAFPLEKIEAVLNATGRQSKRKRQLPAATMVHYVIALGLFVSLGCREVLRRLLEGAKWIWPYEIRISTESAITQARQRLGWEPIEQLYRQVVQPLAKKITRAAWYRQWRVVTLDGTMFDVSDSDENGQEFGRPGSSRGGGSSYPQVRVVGLVENGTHVLFGAEVSGCRTGEPTLARKILRCLRRNMLCLADRNFFSYELWQQAQKTGAALVWRLRRQINVVRTKHLADGSYLGKIFLTKRHAKRDEGGVTVRLIEYRIDGYRETYRILTTILDPSRAPALELAYLYSHRWTIETAFDEIKTHLRDGRIVLRSKLPDLVRQDVFGLLLAHFGVRFVMHEAALLEDIETEELSFVHTLRVVHRKLPWLVAFPPSTPFTHAAIHSH